MPYVQRDENGVVIGLFANSQSPYAMEWLEDDASEVVEFLNPPKPPPSKTCTTCNGSGRVPLELE